MSSVNLFMDWSDLELKKLTFIMVNGEYVDNTLNSYICILDKLSLCLLSICYQNYLVESIR